MALPAKTGIRVYAIIASAQRNLEATRRNGYSADVADGVVSCFVEGLAEALLNQEQQEQIQVILELWRKCSSAAIVGEVQSSTTRQYSLLERRKNDERTA